MSSFAFLDPRIKFIDSYSKSSPSSPLYSCIHHFPKATQLRTTASQTLSKPLTQHSTTYPSLSPRKMKALLLALISPAKSYGTREDAIRGLVGMNKEAVWKGLAEGAGAKVVAAGCDAERGADPSS